MAPARLLTSLFRSSRVTLPSTRSLYFRNYSVANTAQDDFPQPPKAPETPAEALAEPSVRGQQQQQQQQEEEEEESPRPLMKNSWLRNLRVNDHAIEIPLKQGFKSHHHALLRDGCKCPLCIDQSTKQRNFKTTDIPVDIKPRSVKWDGSRLEVKWENDIPGFPGHHTSVYDEDAIQRVEANPEYSSAGRRRRRTVWNRLHMEENTQFWISYDEYMNDEVAFAEAMHQLAQTGIIFLKKIPGEREMVEKIATRMGPLRNTFYGPTWDVRSVPQAKNVAYTDQDLGMHMDLMYMNEPPGYQLLHCIENSCEGGESLFADTFWVASSLMRTHPKIFELLCNFHINYEYNHDDHVYCNRWPVIEWFKDHKANQVKITRVNYSPPFQAPIYHRYAHDHHVVTRSLQALKVFNEWLNKPQNQFELKLQPGECVIFENRRVVHARRAFDTNSGRRWLAGAYVDEDSLLSRFATLHRKYPDVWRRRVYRPLKKAEKWDQDPVVY
ncbi:hypothetical protein BDV25DRAFT_156758 [Aspergillus avenaceus]|uniref:TauD/TfdA-like domain-containing protein n=1 Tax=Aspergillus avenaceus TaxID=36643 RepID=A0A5N6TSB2_ASPAV|nr:hypothetical protein BDV25DRAFT_156758 [Aspergillus avenaceus]